MVPPGSYRVPTAPPYSGFGLGSDRIPRTGLSPAPARLSRHVPLRILLPLMPALQPRARLDARGLGSSPFARRYSGSHCCFPFLRLLRCFSSSGWQPLRVGTPPACRVSPFGHPRIIGRSRLPAAFRSLPRPSSPPGAKASPVRLVVLVAYRASPAALAAAGPLSILALSLLEFS